MRPYIKAFAIKDHEGQIPIKEFMDYESLQDIKDYLQKINLTGKDRIELDKHQFFI